MKTIEENNALIAKPKWEKVNDSSARLPVYGGWIITTKNGYDDRECSVFIPDAFHSWIISTEEAPDVSFN